MEMAEGKQIKLHDTSAKAASAFARDQGSEVSPVLSQMNVTRLFAVTSL
jgi:hypothetical protein